MSVRRIAPTAFVIRLALVFAPRKASRTAPGRPVLEGVRTTTPITAMRVGVRRPVARAVSLFTTSAATAGAMARRAAAGNS